MPFKLRKATSLAVTPIVSVVVLEDKDLGNSTLLSEAMAPTLAKSKGRILTYKWCTGPGHGGKPMWVCGHEPGACDENYKGNDRNSSRKSNSDSGASDAKTGNGGDAEASIQALRAVLEDTDFGDDPSAQIMACLALLRD